MGRSALWLPVLAGFVLLAAAALLLPAGCAGTPDCRMNSECPEGYYCLRGECVRDCVDSDLDCDPGYYCNPDLGACMPVDPGTGGSTTSSSGQGGATSSGTTSSGTGGGQLTELELCAASSDCAAGLSCQPMVRYGPQRCTRSCSDSSQCMTGTRCLGGLCLGDDIGRWCSDETPCSYGCLVGPAYCTAPCVSGADCPGGYGCMEIGTPPQRVCIKAEAYCNGTDSSACVVSAACDLSPTLIIGGCTLACSSAADCPQRAAPLPDWSCDGLCRRPADVVGSLPGGYTPVEYHCNAQQQPVNLCNDAMHMDFAQWIIPSPPAVSCQSPMTTPGVAGDACVSTCRYQGGCPFGFACVALGNVGNERIGLCLPTGTSEPGTACSSHPECAFGYCGPSNICSRDCTADGVCPGGQSCVAGEPPGVEGATFRRCQ